MIIALSGTPGTGKTTTAGLLKEEGWEVVHLNELIEELGAHEGRDGDTGELIVDEDKLSDVLKVWAKGVSGDVLVEGHLSYLAPASLVLLFRIDPNALRSRLLARGYDEVKAQENAEAEAISFILFESCEREMNVLYGREWTELPEDCPLVLEVDTTRMTPREQASWVREMVSARREGRTEVMRPFRPPVVDWMEVVFGWY